MSDALDPFWRSYYSSRTGVIPNVPSIVRSAVLTASLITLTAVKKHLRREDSTAEDENIQTYLDAACAYVEAHTGYALSQSSYVQIQRFWNNSLENCELLRYPVNSITSIKYYDTDGTEQTIPSTSYRLVSEAKPCVVIPLATADFSWPETDNNIGSVRIEFKAGPTSIANVPPMLQSAIYQLVAMQFELRSPIVVDRKFDTIPEGIRWIMDKERIRGVLL